MEMKIYDAVVNLQDQHDKRILPQLAVPLAKVFHTINPQLYEVYAANQIAALAMCKSRMAEHDAFRDLITECERDDMCNRLALPDFIVKPLQRSTKYPLLFKDIRKPQMGVSVLPSFWRLKSPLLQIL